jgi:hypothetical protein
MKKLVDHTLAGAKVVANSMDEILEDFNAAGLIKEFILETATHSLTILESWNNDTLGREEDFAALSDIQAHVAKMEGAIAKMFKDIDQLMKDTDEYKEMHHRANLVQAIATQGVAQGKELNTLSKYHQYYDNMDFPAVIAALGDMEDAMEHFQEATTIKAADNLIDSMERGLEVSTAALSE